MYLTGLIKEKTDVLPHIKKMFDYLAIRNGISIDYYCHFWDPSNRYPYNIDDTEFKITVPKESNESINYAIDIFDPTNYSVVPYKNMYDGYLSWFIQTHYNVQSADKFTETVKYCFDNHLFYNKTINKKFFIDNFVDDVDKKFNNWWFHHISWCTFSHKFSQLYSASSMMELISNSNKDYDAILKWRYDVIANYHRYESRIIETLKISKYKNYFFTDTAWVVNNGESNFNLTKDDINYNYKNKEIYLNDIWWITNKHINDVILRSLHESYLKNMNIKGGTHRWLYKTLRDCDIDIDIVGKIDEIIIRFPNTIPDEFHNCAGKYYEYLQNNNFRKKEKSDYNNIVRNHDDRSLYHTTKFFDFY